MANHTISLLSGSVLDPAGTALIDTDLLGGILTVNADGYIFSTAPASANGAELGGGGSPWTVNVNGAIGTYATASSGLFLPGGGTATINVGLDGTIFGAAAGSWGIYTTRVATITNKGTISGTKDGIFADISAAFGNSTFTSSGKITGGINGIEFDPAGVGIHKITNSGTITGGTKAILAGLGIEQIVNRGTITGDIQLGGGNDTFTNFQKVGTKTIAGKVQGTIDLGEGNDTFNGGAGAETVSGGDGVDSIKLGGGNDTYLAQSPTFVAENETIDGGTGIDTYDATGAGAAAAFVNLDTVAHDSALIFSPSIDGKTAFGFNISGNATPDFKDTITGFENFKGDTNDDVVYGSAVANSIDGGDGADHLSGFGGNDTLLGGTGADELEGGLGNDSLLGGDDSDFLVGDVLVGFASPSTGVGADTLDGGAGVDFLRGGAGKDVLIGGTEDDFFDFFSKAYSGVTAATRDTITDFEGSGLAGGDKIRFFLDADERAISPGDQAFTFTANDGFGAFTVGTAGQLRFQITAAGTIVTGETTGDGKADFSILVNGQHHFETGDFFL